MSFYSKLGKAALATAAITGSALIAAGEAKAEARARLASIDIEIEMLRKEKSDLKRTWNM